jgi:DNA-nicking Smr family endonuclease
VQGRADGADGRAIGRRSGLIPLLRRLLREVFGLVPTLDLHGLGVADALAETERFLREMAARGEREVRVVYGKGRGSPGGVGVLRQAIPGWLEQHGAGLVERFERVIDRDGNDGAMRVWLAPARARGEESGEESG